MFELFKKILSLFTAVILFFVSIFSVHAQEPFEIKDFKNEIVINQDTSLSVKEQITVDFFESRHGIFRDIPLVYSYRGRTIKADFDLVSIKDENGDEHQYEIQNFREGIRLKIGDPNTTINGEQVYIIEYQIDDILQRFEEHDELYWNVTGHGWDVNILSSEAIVKSPYADIVKTDCFSGSVGLRQSSCSKNINENIARFDNKSTMRPGEDFTIVVGLDKENDLIFPAGLIALIDEVTDNLSYVLVTIPLLIISFLWLKRGRDAKFVGDNIYYEQDDKKQQTVSVFERKFLPMVYYPIDGLSPSEAGTIIDEKVHISDVIAEILELARLGFLKIQRIEKKRFIRTQTDYAFVKTEKTDDVNEKEILEGYQEYLLKEVFRSTAIHKSVKEAEKLLKGRGAELEAARKLLSNNEYVLLSRLKNHFYEGLPVFKKKLYKTLDAQEIFRGNPDHVRQLWIGIFVAMEIIVAVIILQLTAFSHNIIPLLLLIPFGLVGLIFAYSMPRRKAKGYALKRQIEGLKWYLEKGEWKHEIAEKRLFIEEMLPFAVALGVVDKLAEDMKELNIKPPSYFAGTSLGSFSNDFSNFSRSTSSTLMSAPGGKWSGSSSWSGGSGFSGGSSGGGFGGGGGGSW